LVFSVSACSPIADIITSSPSATSTPTAVTPQASHTPRPTASLTPAPTVTLAPSPIPAEAPWWWDNLQGFEQLLPFDAEPSYGQIWEWATRRGCTSAKSIIVVPYRLPNGQWNIIAVNGRDRNNPNSKPTIYWDWQQETVKSGYWREIRYLAEPRGWTTLSFLGLDENGLWWIVAVGGACEAPSLSAVLPVMHPEKVFFEASWLEQEKRTLYWVLDDTCLNLYEWKDNKPISLWTIDNAPDVTVRPNLRQDFTGDGKPELALTWGQDEGGIMQIYQSEGTGFRLLGEVETNYHQYSDVDGDHIAEFLWPVPNDAPTEWKVYGWNGEQFVWKEPLSKPTTHTTNIEASIASPTCPFNLVRVQHYEGSSYSVGSSDGTVNWEIPNTFTYVGGYSTFAWDANCNFLIHARADGGSGLYRLDLSSGKVETVLSLANSRGYGAVQPIARTNGDIIFTIQGLDAKLYPPLGIYRLTSDGNLQLLADIPPLTGSEDQDSPIYYGTLIRSPNGEFVYQSP